ncbi:MAG: hypothetical protein J6I49_03555 [Bacteroidales bacterium]|nr:hypothetical protein [Bacteroidales bacterium]
MDKKEITSAQIEQWKKEHGKVFVAKADGKTAYYRKPTRKDLSYAMTLQEQPLDMSEMLLKQCFLGGDSVLHEEVDYLLGCMGELTQRMMTVKQVEVGEA